MEGAQSSLQSATQRGRHRGQSHLQRLVDRLHQSNHIVRLKAAQLLGGLANIAVVDVSQEAPITTRAHHCIIQSTVSGLLMSESYIHMDQKPVVWKVRFPSPNAPGGTAQDYDEV